MKYIALLRPCALGLMMALAVPLAWGQSGTQRLADGPRDSPAATADPAAIAGGPPAAAFSGRAGANPWSLTYDPLRDFRSTASRAEVQSQFLGARHEVEAFTGEDSGSAYLRTTRR